MLFHICVWLEHNPWIIGISRSVFLSIVIAVTHYFSVFCLVGSVVMVDLRILGVVSSQKGIKELAEDLLPWMWIGLALVILSGFFMFAGDATAFYAGGVFHIKMLLLILAIVSGVITQRRVSRWDRLQDVPIAAKVIALASLLLWIGVILAAVETPEPYLSPTLARIDAKAVRVASDLKPVRAIARRGEWKGVTFDPDDVAS